MSLFETVTPEQIEAGSRLFAAVFGDPDEVLSGGFEPTMEDHDVVRRFAEVTMNSEIVAIAKKVADSELEDIPVPVPAQVRTLIEGQAYSSLCLGFALGLFTAEGAASVRD